jgi:hypothetical protein
MSSTTAQTAIAVVGIDIGKNSFHIVGDVAPSFYPTAIGVWWSALPSWAVVAAVRGAEPSVQRSAADRRCAA